MIAEGGRKSDNSCGTVKLCAKPWEPFISLVAKQIESNILKSLAPRSERRPHTALSTQLCVEDSLAVCLCPAGGRLLVHVPLGDAADVRKREPRAAKRPMASPGSLVSGTVLHVLADHATVQLDNGEQPDTQLFLSAELYSQCVGSVPLHPVSCLSCL